ncbi:MAG: hypothetical protein JWP52_3709 [Rhizobacter sp.]|nr:hypothetical protein [Rhizobacter sp.]
MFTPRFLIAAALSSVLSLAVPASMAQATKAGALTIDHPYARSTSAGKRIGGGYLKLDNQGGADRLLSVTAPVSAKVELHTMSMDGNVMRMREVDGIDLPAGKSVELKPGGMHIMFVDLKAPLKAGDSFPLTLKFQKAGETTVTVKVEGANAAPAAQGDHTMPGMKH